MAEIPDPVLQLKIEGWDCKNTKSLQIDIHQGWAQPSIEWQFWPPVPPTGPGRLGYQCLPLTKQLFHERIIVPSQQETGGELRLGFPYRLNRELLVFVPRRLANCFHRTVETWVRFHEKVENFLRQQQEQCTRVTKLKLKLLVGNFRYGGHSDFKKHLREEEFRNLFSLLKTAFPNVTVLVLHRELDLDLDLIVSCRDDYRILPFLDDWHALLMEYFPNLVDLTLDHCQHPLTFERIGSHLKNLRTLRIGSAKNDSLTPDTSVKLADTLLNLPSLEEFVYTDWKVCEANRKECLEPLICALGYLQPDLRVHMSRNGSYGSRNRFGRVTTTPYGMPTDQWNTMRNGILSFDYIMNQTKRRYNLPDNLQYDGGPLSPWVDAALKLHRFDRLDCFHFIFQQLPMTLWLGSCCDYLQMSLLRCINLDGTKTITLQDHVIELSQHAIGNTAEGTAAAARALQSDEGKQAIRGAVKDDFDQMIGRIESLEEVDKQRIGRINSLEESLEEEKRQRINHVKSLEESLEEEKRKHVSHVKSSEKQKQSLEEENRKHVSHVKSLKGKNQSLEEKNRSLEEEKQSLEAEKHQLIERVDRVESWIVFACVWTGLSTDQSPAFSIQMVLVFFFILLCLWSHCYRGREP